MPYKSDAQRRYFNANRDELESEGVDVDEWNESSKGKKLPEKAKKTKKAAALATCLSKLAEDPSGAFFGAGKSEPSDAYKGRSGSAFVPTKKPPLSSQSVSPPPAPAGLAGVLKKTARDRLARIISPTATERARYLLSGSLPDDPINLFKLSQAGSPPLASSDAVCDLARSAATGQKTAQVFNLASIKLASMRQRHLLLGPMRPAGLRRRSREHQKLANVLGMGGVSGDPQSAMPQMMGATATGAPQMAGVGGTGLDAPTPPGTPAMGESGLDGTTPGENLMGPDGTHNSPATNPIGMMSGLGATPGVGSSMGNAAFGTANSSMGGAKTAFLGLKAGLDWVDRLQAGEQAFGGEEETELTPGMLASSGLSPDEAAALLESEKRNKKRSSRRVKLSSWLEKLGTDPAGEPPLELSYPGDPPPGKPVRPPTLPSDLSGAARDKPGAYSEPGGPWKMYQRMMHPLVPIDPRGPGKRHNTIGMAKRGSLSAYLEKLAGPTDPAMMGQGQSPAGGQTSGAPAGTGQPAAPAQGAAGGGQPETLAAKNRRLIQESQQVRAQNPPRATMQAAQQQQSGASPAWAVGSQPVANQGAGVPHAGGNAP